MRMINHDDNCDNDDGDNNNKDKWWIMNDVKDEIELWWQISLIVSYDEK